MNNDTNTLIEHCNNLTKNGERLWISWDGGHDEGAYRLMVNDDEICEPSELDKQLLDVVESHVGYSTFSSEFSASGEVTYDQKTTSFLGADDCEYEDQQNCSCTLDVIVPKEIWFDRLIISIQKLMGHYTEVGVSFVILHGPYTEEHSKREEIIKESVTNRVTEELDNACKEEYTTEVEFTINRKDCSDQTNSLHYMIKEIPYFYYKSDYTDIAISLHTKPIIHDQLQLIRS